MLHTDNKLGDECANVIGNMLYTNKILTNLDLSGVMQTFSPIQKLLSYTDNIISKGGKRILHGLKVNATIRSLNLSRNQLSHIIQNTNTI